MKEYLYDNIKQYAFLDMRYPLCDKRVQNVSFKKVGGDSAARICYFFEDISNFVSAGLSDCHFCKDVPVWNGSRRI